MKIKNDIVLLEHAMNVGTYGLRQFARNILLDTLMGEDSDKLDEKGFEDKVFDRAADEMVKLIREEAVIIRDVIKGAK